MFVILTLIPIGSAFAYQTIDNSQNEIIEMTLPQPHIKEMLDHANTITDPKELEEHYLMMENHGVFRNELFDSDPEYVQNKILENAPPIPDNFDQEHREPGLDQFKLLEQFDYLTVDPDCRKCKSDKKDNMVFFPGVRYDCDRTVQCVATVRGWVNVDEQTTESTIFNFRFTANNPDLSGFYFAKAPTDSKLADWTHGYGVSPAGFETEKNYQENASKTKYKELEEVKNNNQRTKVAFVFSVHDIR